MSTYISKNAILTSLSLLHFVQSIVTNCGIALQDWQGDREMNELRFSYGALVTNIKNKTKEWSLGDHRGDKQKYFKRSCVRLLTKDELAFVNDLVSVRSYRAIFPPQATKLTNTHDAVSSF